MRFFDFILSHSFFVSFCAASLALHSQLLFGLPPDYLLVAFIFLSTLFTYNGYWLLSKYVFSKPANLNAFFIRNYRYLLLMLLSAISVLCLLPLIKSYLPYILGGGLLTVIYLVMLVLPGMRSRYASLGFIKTILLALTWTFLTVTVPLSQSEADVKLVWGLFANRFLLMFILCAIFDNKAVKEDEERDIYTIATGLSGKYYNEIMMIVFGLFAIAGLWVKGHLQGLAGIYAFMAMYFVTYIVFELSKRRRSYYFYYFIVDGLMLLPLITYLLVYIF